MNTVDSVWKFVDKRAVDECWPWTGYVSNGRGRIDIECVKGVYASRAAYLSANPGAIDLRLDADRSQCICHTCDNGMCCNPSHMFVGSHQDNMDDKVSKNRQARFKSIESPRAKLTSEDVFWMRIQKKYGATKKALAALYDVSEATVSGALYGRHYRDVA